jgi:hypothetical protein
MGGEEKEILKKGEEFIGDGVGIFVWCNVVL